MEYTVIRSNRRTIALEIKPDLKVVVRAPRFMREKEIEAFVANRHDWLIKHLEIQRKRLENRPPEPTAEEEQACRRKAAAILPPLVERYAALMGVTPTSVRVTGAKTRFGSCSGKNALCFSWRLMLYPMAAIEYVVVHELAHICQHNHSAAFYRVIESVMPDYHERAALLKQ